MHMKNKRHKIWIDTTQTKIMVRIAAYFVIMQVTLIGSWLIFQQFFTTVSLALGTDLFTFNLVFLTGICLIPALLFLYDILKMGHRIVGPIYRFRKTVQAIAGNQEVSFVRLRKDDYFVDFQDDLNRMIKMLADRGVIRLRDETQIPAPSQPELVLREVSQSAAASNVEPRDEVADSSGR